MKKVIQVWRGKRSTFFILCSCREKIRDANIHLLDNTGGKMVIFRSSVLQSLKSEVVLQKTQTLTNKDIIGSGGYGVVYELRLDESIAFAVKRLSRGTAERDKGFERELEAMADIKHRNIVTLHGYYTAPHYNFLIYELMPNGSLDSFLHGMYLLVSNIRFLRLLGMSHDGSKWRKF